MNTTTETGTKLPTISEVLASPFARTWVKEALQAALNRDAVDAAYDAKLVADLLMARIGR